jgi:hypothetical protein
MGFVQVDNPQNPPDAKRPPLYPLLLQPIFLFGSGSILGAQIVTAFFGLGSLLLLIWGWGRTGALIAVLSLFNYFWLSFNAHIMTEIPFEFFMLLALVLTDRACAKGELTPKIRVGIALLIAVATLCRTVGVLVLPAILLSFWRSEVPWKKWALIPVYAGLFYLPYLLSPVAEGYGEDVASYPGIAKVLSINSDYYWKILPYLMGVYKIPGTENASPLLIHLFSFFLLAGMLLGVKVVVQQKRFLELAVTAAFVALFALWPFQDPRFLLPVLPFLYFLLLRGLQYAFTRGTSSRRGLFIGFTVVLFFQVVYLTVPVLQSIQGIPQPRPDVFAWMEENTDPDDIVLSAEAGVWLQTGRRVIPLAPQQRIVKYPESWLENIYLLDTDWVLLQKDPRQTLMEPFVQTVPDHFVLAYKDEKYSLYRVVGDRGDLLEAIGWHRAGHRLFFQNQRAIPEFRKALELEPWLPVTRFMLANQLLAEGRKTEAVKELETLLTYQPQFEDARLLLEQLRGPST